MSYEDFKPRFERLLERVLTDKKLTSNSKSLVKEHIAYLQAQGRDTKTLIKHLYCMKVFVDFAEGKVDFKTMSRKDIEGIIAKLESSDYKPETRRNVKSIVKAFGDILQVQTNFILNLFAGSEPRLIAKTG